MAGNARHLPHQSIHVSQNGAPLCKIGPRTGPIKPETKEAKALRIHERPRRMSDMRQVPRCLRHPLYERAPPCLRHFDRQGKPDPGQRPAQPYPDVRHVCRIMTHSYRRIDTAIRYTASTFSTALRSAAAHHTHEEFIDVRNTVEHDASGGKANLSMPSPTIAPPTASQCHGVTCR